MTQERISPQQKWNQSHKSSIRLIKHKYYIRHKKELQLKYKLEMRRLRQKGELKHD